MDAKCDKMNAAISQKFAVVRCTCARVKKNVTSRELVLHEHNYQRTSY